MLGLLLIWLGHPFLPIYLHVGGVMKWSILSLMFNYYNAWFCTTISYSMNRSVRKWADKSTSELVRLKLLLSRYYDVSNHYFSRFQGWSVHSISLFHLHRHSCCALLFYTLLFILCSPSPLMHFVSHFCQFFIELSHLDIRLKKLNFCPTIWVFRNFNLL